MDNRHGVFLSLKDDFYRTHMYGYFRRLRQRNGEEEKAAVKEEAFKFFINSGHTLLKLHNWNRPELGHCVVDEKYTRTSECRDREPEKKLVNLLLCILSNRILH